MARKCGNCGWSSDKCKNPNNPNYNKFRDKDDRCNGYKIKKTGAGNDD